MRKHYPLNSNGAEDAGQLPWKDGVPSSGIEGSYPGQALFTDAESEILSAIDGSGQTRNGSDLAQLIQAIGRGVYLSQFSGTANALAAALPNNVVFASLLRGMRFTGFVTNTNTAGVTVAITGIGTAGNTVQAPLLRKDGKALQAGDLPVSQDFEIRFDGSAFRLVGTANNSDGLRTRPIANIDLYVSTTGSDTAGDGLTAATAWATPQKAWDTLQRTYDITGLKATVHLVGAFTSGIQALGPVVGAQSVSSIVFQGASSATTSISAASASCFSAQNGAAFSVSGVKLSATGTGSGQGAGLYTTPGGIIQFGSDINFGACDVAHTFAQGGQITSSGAPYVISGSAQAHLDAQLTGIVTVSAPVTLLGTPTFYLAYAVAAFYGLVYAGGSSFSGSATGSRYSTSSGAIIVNGAGANYLPGSLGGIANAPGFYM